MTTFTAPGTAILQALAAVLPHVAKPVRGRPVLENIQIKSDGTTLTFAATDSFTLGAWTLDVDAVPAFDVVFNARDLAARLKGLDKKSMTWTVAIDDGSMHVDDGLGGSVSIAVAFGEFPRWASLVPAEHGATGVEKVAYDATFIGRFAKAVDRNLPMVMTWGPRGASGPAIITIGDSFTGLITSRRLDA